ncbi:ribonuclease HII [Candidatus Endomicrobiellum trichonymphae]|uniref:Ribonuclease HII n=1 Tax=Endomicrobium trichonymphae TaxID=1408204 RepID=RNH2_ENDTX|nr:ribonuclease HII [Candidatus Endomicrobium trichonymphae]B1GZ18.1 RecName: Full=Ribonuclease HII; Short=RNase HII [Candidatus Endomicrobium trichonymphae]BAG13500.1 ribonuclease HII [Candidatus Endomicrobium trichonymphae]BAV58596.1 ribonuclease HII [Candidatus Endomicrobium trichonymphae]
MFSNIFSFDRNFYNKGFYPVAGIDEAGRGPLAGPVVAAVVILPKDSAIPYLNDSKQLSEKKREILFEIIKETALDYAVELVNNEIIDEINILQATFLAMSRAVLKLKTQPDLYLIDGNRKVHGLSFNQETIVGGDAKSACIAAASILAKVSRDKMMLEYAKQYPVYEFEKHKGYGTKKHIEALKKHGICPIHRLTFSPVNDIISQTKLNI